MKIYSIFDDFDKEAISMIEKAGGTLEVHPRGIPRPDNDQMKSILEEYDCVIIGTSQKIYEDMFDRITSTRIIATASVGLDHIRIPEEKKKLVTIINTPTANAQSVAEYTIGCALSCVKRLTEGCNLYKKGNDNKKLFHKPEDLAGKTIGVIGAGNISCRIMEYAQWFGMKVICWTRNPGNHRDLLDKGIRFVTLEELASVADVVSVNLPNNFDTKGIISADLINKMKPISIFISVSRLDTIDVITLFEKAKAEKLFYVCLDLDVNDNIVRQMPDQHNVMVTPHIAGGTVETRKRMFIELAESIAKIIERRFDLGNENGCQEKSLS